MEALWHGASYPGTEIVIGRRDFSDLEKTTLSEFLRSCPPELYQPPGQYHRTKHTMTWVTGVKFYFMELKDPDSLLSANLSGLFFDEAKEIPRDTYANAMGCLRITPEHRIRNMMLLGAPEEEARAQVMASEPIQYLCCLGSNPGPGWVKELFVDNSELVEDGVYRTASGFVYIPSKIADNQENLPADYAEQLAATYGESERRRYLEGDWGVFEGRIFPTFYRDTHVIPTFEPPRDWRFYLGIDYGLAAPTSVHLWALDEHDNLFTCGEHYVAGQPIEWHVRQCYEKWGDYPILEAPIDPSTKKQKSQFGGRIWTPYEEWQYWCRELGWDLNLKAANNDVNGGINLISRLLTPRLERVHPITGLSPAPQFYIMDNNPKAIHEMETYAFKQPRADNMNAPERPIKSADHYCDETRYIVNRCFARRVLPQSRRITARWN